MEEEEFEDLEVCADCGLSIAGSTSSFVFSDLGVLCFACALRRGGRYDGENDAWIVPPDLSGLPQEQRP